MTAKGNFAVGAVVSTMAKDIIGNGVRAIMMHAVIFAPGAIASMMRKETSCTRIGEKIK